MASSCLYSIVSPQIKRKPPPNTRTTASQGQSEDLRPRPPLSGGTSPPSSPWSVSGDRSLLSTEKLAIWEALARLGCLFFGQSSLRTVAKLTGGAGRRGGAECRNSWYFGGVLPKNRSATVLVWARAPRERHEAARGGSNSYEGRAAKTTGNRRAQSSSARASTSTRIPIRPPRRS